MLIYLQTIEDEADKIKFAVIYQRYRNLMFHIAATFLSDPRDREEAVQEAFFAIAKNIAKLPDPSCIKTKTFIVTVIENKAIDIYRKNKRRPTEALREEQEGLSFTLPTGDAAAAIAKLPPRERNFIVLKYAEGYPNKELSKMLGLTYSGVNSLDHRAKAKLRKLLKEEGIEV